MSEAFDREEFDQEPGISDHDLDEIFGRVERDPDEVETDYPSGTPFFREKNWDDMHRKKSNKQLLRLRKDIYRNLSRWTLAWVIVTLFLTVLNYLPWPNLDMPATIVVVLLTTATANVFGLYHYILRYVFSPASSILPVDSDRKTEVD